MANNSACCGGLVDATRTAKVSFLYAPPIHKDAAIHVENMPPKRHYFSEDTSADVPSLEGSSLDVQSSASNLESGFVALRVRINDDGDDSDYEVCLATSSETFDSASEHMDALSNIDPMSPTGSFKEMSAHSEVSSITLSRALRNLNELNSGVASLDISLLENTSEQDFRFRMMEIAVANHLSLDDEVVHEILNTLLPHVRENLAVQKREVMSDVALSMPVARLTADDDDDYTEGSDDADVNLMTEVSKTDQSENTELWPYSAGGLPVCVAVVADDEPEEQEVFNDLLPSMLSDMAEHELPTLESRHRSANLNTVRYQSTSDGGEHVQFQSLSLSEDASVANSADADANMGTCVHIDQPVGAKEESTQIVNVASSDQRISESIASSDYSRHLSSHQETFNDTSEKDLEEDGEIVASRKETALSSKDSTATSTGLALFDNVYLPAQPTCWGHDISSIESGIPFSGSHRLTREIDELQMLRLKLLCVAFRLRQSTSEVVTQVLNRLALADCLRGRSWLRESDLETLRLFALELEAGGQGDLGLECKVLVLGKSGNGKSATINSLFGKAQITVTDAYKPATKEVKEIIGTVNGLKLRVIDTPGFLTSFADKQYNLKILSSIKRNIKKSPPDIVLYVDRLDLQCRDYGDLPLFQAISGALGDAIWYNTIVVFTHGSSAPLEGPNNAPEDYGTFVTQRFLTLQETICQAAGGDEQLKLPFSIVENRAEVWHSQLLLLCFASKILSEASHVWRSQKKPLCVYPHVPSLQFLLASMLESQAHLKLPNEQVDDEEEFDFNEEAASSDDELEYEDLPSFRCLTKEELTLLGKEQRELYHDEQKCMEKLFMKQLKDGRARRKELNRGLAASSKEASDLIDEHHEETIPGTMPDMVLPILFDSDSPTHRYHSLDTTNGLHVQPILNTHGWDHDIGYNGLRVKKVSLIPKKIPVSVSGQITKDKKETSVQIKCGTSFKSGNWKSVQAGLDIHTIGKEVVYIVHRDPIIGNIKKHKITCEFSVAVLGDTLSAGMKLEDCLVVGKGWKLAIGGGVLTGQQRVAYGGYLRAFSKDEDYPTDQSLSTIGLSIMNWKDNFAIGGDWQMKFLLGQTMIIGRANLNNVRAGKISIHAKSSDQFPMALIGLFPLLRGLIFNKIAGFWKSLQ